jgi:hypothetical protein
MKKTCLQCGRDMRGRSDKKFCSLNCKNLHHIETRQQIKNVVAETDAYLHRNRTILFTLMGSSNKEIFDKLVLDRTGFRWEFHTGTYLNKEGKMYRIVYDFAWLDFSDQKILIVKKKNK